MTDQVCEKCGATKEGEERPLRVGDVLYFTNYGGPRYYYIVTEIGEGRYGIKGRPLGYNLPGETCSLATGSLTPARIR